MPLRLRMMVLLLAAVIGAESAPAGESTQAKEMARIRKEVRAARKGWRATLKDLRVTDPDQARFYELGDLGERQIKAGKLDETEVSARELLTVAQRFECDWNYGNAIHQAQILLGRVALARGDRETAKARLLDAGRTPSSPQLASAGPDCDWPRRCSSRENGRPYSSTSNFALRSGNWADVTFGGGAKRWRPDSYPSFAERCATNATTANPRLQRTALAHRR